ncbi:hypothetical protein HUG10_02590 [Halorarum halophilum]|uniref:DUF7308 domain-containing protein n=1 Tax=Halorarum halophilum TaxID=2743090 RepID=A0A7D5K676_9EURY|nr:archaellin/type IV pilin N-terminal domain-containing protein [Halobaculum halophilum]QLG26494.1 hypothetical protein HUG10_02590 [Halobaculum halophilum]
MTDVTGTRGQSSTIGFVLLIVLTVAGAGAVVGLGGQALEDTRSASTVDRVENAMTQFDSRASMVALGDASGQRVRFGGGGGGTYSVDEDAGWIRVTHRNYTDGDDYEVYNGSLGAVRYTNDDTTVAYQGGGVWRSDGDGSVMVSPPEVTYRRATLTLPVIRTMGDGGAGGSPTAYVRSEGPTESRYPNGNESLSYPGGRSHLNPVRNGTVTLTVHSEFYEAWGRYFDTRTEGNVTVFHGNRTAMVELKTGGAVGDFRLSSRGSTIDARGIAEGHSIEDLSITLGASDNGNDFNNMRFSIHAREDGREFELLIHTDEKPRCSDGGSLENSPKLSYDVLFENESTSGYHVWGNDSVDATSGPIRYQCVGDEPELVLDFTGDTDLEYGVSSISAGDREGEFEGSVLGDVTFGHDGEDGEETTFSTSGETDSRHLVRHYMAEMGQDVELTVYYATGGGGGGMRIDSDPTGRFDYDTAEGPQYITYLHITENSIRVEFE